MTTKLLRPDAHDQKSGQEYRESTKPWWPSPSGRAPLSAMSRCQAHVKATGLPCENQALPKYGHRFCGIHRAQFQPEVAKPLTLDGRPVRVGDWLVYRDHPEVRLEVQSLHPPTNKQRRAQVTVGDAQDKARWYLDDCAWPPDEEDEDWQTTTPPPSEADAAPPAPQSCAPEAAPPAPQSCAPEAAPPAPQSRAPEAKTKRHTPEPQSSAPEPERYASCPVGDWDAEFVAVAPPRLVDQGVVAVQLKYYAPIQVVSLTAVVFDLERLELCGHYCASAQYGQSQLGLKVIHDFGLWCQRVRRSVQQRHVVMEDPTYELNWLDAALLNLNLKFLADQLEVPRVVNGRERYETYLGLMGPERTTGPPVCENRLSRNPLHESLAPARFLAYRFSEVHSAMAVVQMRRK